MRWLAGACLALGFATPAHADWQGFKWGMKEKQVEAAETDIEVYRLETPKSWRMRPITSTLGGKWIHEGHEYEVFFFFNERGKLELIELEPAGLACEDRIGAFAQRFGEYEEESTPLGPAQRTIARWRLGKGAVLTTLVVQFSSSDEWSCRSMIREPFGR